MHEAATQKSEPERQEETRRGFPRVAVGVALAVVAAAVLLPAILMVTGAFLVIAVGIHVWAPALRPYSDLILRVPVARARRRHTHLAVAAGAGVLLVAAGAGSATLRGQFLSERAQLERDQEAAAEKVDELFVDARQRLDSGDAGGAEFVLMNAEGVDTERRSEVDELLDRMRRSADSAVILEILVELDAEDFAAMEDGSAVPEALDFGEPALTYRAVELAITQLDEARHKRTAH